MEPNNPKMSVSGLVAGTAVQSVLWSVLVASVWTHGHHKAAVTLGIVWLFAVFGTGYLLQKEANKQALNQPLGGTV